MNFNRKILFIVIIGIVVLPVQGIAVGPANVRGQDFLILMLFSYFIISGQNLSFQRVTLKIVFPLIVIGVYSVLLLPIQSFSIANSVVALIELSSYVILFLLISNYMMEMKNSYYYIITYSIFLLTVIGSVAAIFHFVYIGSRFVGVPYIIGIVPVGLYFGLIYSIAYSKPTYILGTSLIFVRVLLSNTRTFWILLPIPLLFILLYHRRFAGSITIKGIFQSIVIGIAGIIVSLFINPLFLSRLRSILEGSQGLFIRPIRWYSGVQLIERYPLGVGLGNYASAVSYSAQSGGLDYPDWFRRLAGEDLITQQLSVYQTGAASAHSDFFKFFVELGPIGLVFFLLFLIFIFEKTLNQVSSPLVLVFKSSILYVLLRVMVNPGLLSGNITYLIILVSTYNVIISNLESTHTDRPLIGLPREEADYSG
jgi:hypothetical protein